MTTDLRNAFTLARRRWGGDGPGSSAKNTDAIASKLPELLRRRTIRRVVDLGCGDVTWIAPLVLGLDYYMGIDVVPAVIAENQRRYPSLFFSTIGGPKDELPACDLVICRDCIAHLATAQVHGVLDQIARAAPLMLVTNYPTTIRNEDVQTGGFRPLNLLVRPFSLPQPIELVKDSERKVMGLWRTTRAHR